MDVTTCLIASLLLIFAIFWFRRTDVRLPPFPVRPLPFVGHLFHMSADFRSQFKEWREKCGDIFSLYMGGTLVVVLSGYDLIQEALVQKADVFSDRPSIYIDEAIGIPDRGILFSKGSTWKEQRSVIVSILKAVGMGKNHLSQKIEEEVANYVGYLRSLDGEPIDIREKTTISVSNVICSILIGHRFEYDDPEFQDLVHKLNSLVADQANVSLVNYFNWLKYLPCDLFKAKKIETSVRAILDLLKRFVCEKTRVVEDRSEVGNLINAFFVERDRKVQSGMSTTLDEESLLKIIFELFGAGTETTSTTIYWCVLYMLHNPGVQEKVYQEIKDKVGTNRNPTIQDKTKLIYLNAVIAETQRLASIVPLSIPHMCSVDVTLRGYTIPKGTQILPNLDSVLHDTTTWGEDALSFRPERFIDDNGKLNIPEQFIPFSAGRRICLGEALTRTELFLFLSFMFQKFQFLPPTPGSVPSLNSVVGIISSPKPFKVRAVERK